MQSQPACDPVSDGFSHRDSAARCTEAPPPAHRAGVNPLTNVRETAMRAARGPVLRPEVRLGAFGWVSMCEDTENNRFGLNSMR